MSEIQVDPQDLLAGWKRRPVLYTVAALCAGLPGEVLVTRAIEGQGAFWWVVPAVLGALLGALLVLWGDGPTRSSHVTWTEGLSSVELQVPLRAPSNRGHWKRATGTVWLGWIGGLVGFALWEASTGRLAPEGLIGLTFFAFWLVMPATGIVDFIGSVIPKPVGRQPTTHIRIDGRVLRVGSEQIVLGRPDQQVRLESAHPGTSRLIVRNGDEKVEITGATLHLKAVQERIRGMSDAGDRADVPAALGRVRTRHRE